MDARKARRGGQEHGPHIYEYLEDFDDLSADVDERRAGRGDASSSSLSLPTTLASVDREGARGRTTSDVGRSRVRAAFPPSIVDY